MADEDLLEIDGIGPKTLEEIRQAAADAKLEWDERDAAAEAERQAAEEAAAQEAAAQQAAAQEAVAQEAVAEGVAAPEPAPGGEAQAATAEPVAAPAAGEEEGTDVER